MSTLHEETLRYLGYKGATDEQTASMVATAIKELATVASPRSLYRLFEVQRNEKGLVISSIETQSRSLTINLDGCDKAFIMAVTLGTGVDTLLRRNSVNNMAYTVVLQAAATAVLEEYCDSVCSLLAEQPELDGRQLRPRFSPGYGDLSLDCQRKIATILGCQRIGLAVTHSLMLAPSKSVTAIVGAGYGIGCKKGGCHECDRLDCTFRRTE